METVSRLVAGKTAYFSDTIEGFFSLVLARLSYKSAGFVFLIFAFVVFESFFPTTSFAFAKPNLGVSLRSPLIPETKSLFTEKVFTKTQSISFSKKVVVDSTLVSGETKTITAGKPGQKTYQTKIIYHNGQEYSRENSLLVDIKPTEEVVAVGLAPNEAFVDTPAGKLKYSRQFNVWATSYDSSCQGCNETTAIGLKAGYGVIAVDPKIIPLRSKVYIPGYGVAVAGDTGGAIKGNRIDLGFDSLANSNWTAHNTSVYILAD